MNPPIQSSSRLAFLGALTLAIPVSAVPIFNPGNGHYYEAIADTTLNWTDAKAAAEAKNHLGASGYLATITSAEEQEFIVANFPEAVAGYILGGYQENNVDWLWVTGEPFVYTNWSPGEPNDFQGNQEDYLQFHGFLPDGNPTGLWNDIGNFPATGYVVEYEPRAVPDAHATASLLALSVSVLALASRKTRS